MSMFPKSMKYVAITLSIPLNILNDKLEWNASALSTKGIIQIHMYSVNNACGYSS